MTATEGPEKNAKGDEALFSAYIDDNLATGISYAITNNEGMWNIRNFLGWHERLPEGMNELTTS